MQVVILAAGRGARLGAKAEGLPKCLLQVGGEPLLERQLRSLADVGASPALVVVGYAADLVRETLRDRAETLLNVRYDSTNSLYSLWLARDWVKGPVLVLNSDVLFDKELLDLLVHAGPDHLAYDSDSGRAVEHMKVRLVDGIVRDLSKTLANGDSSGENVGVVYLGAETARAVFVKADELVKAGRENVFWAEALRPVLAEARIRGVDVAHVPWVEIDTPYDLDRARREVWPAIQNRTGTPTRRRNRRPWWIAAAVVASLAAGILGFRTLATPDAIHHTWEPLHGEGGRAATITVGHMPQVWSQVTGSEPVVLKILGPHSLRIDLRALVPHGTDATIPYKIGVSMDGRQKLLDSFTARPKTLIRHDESTVCDRDKILFKVPPGLHEITVRHEDGALEGLLIRFRMLEEQE